MSILINSVYGPQGLGQVCTVNYRIWYFIRVLSVQIPIRNKSNLLLLSTRNKPRLLLQLPPATAEQNAAIYWAVRSIPRASRNPFAVVKVASLCLTPRNVAKPSGESPLVKLAGLGSYGALKLKHASEDV